jgi:hypothetical protein
MAPGFFFEKATGKIYEHIPHYAKPFAKEQSIFNRIKKLLKTRSATL